MKPTIECPTQPPAISPTAIRGFANGVVFTVICAIFVIAVTG